MLAVRLAAVFAVARFPKRHARSQPVDFEAFRSASLDRKKNAKRKLRELLNNRPIKHPLSTNERAGDAVMAYTVANKRFGRLLAR